MLIVYEGCEESCESSLIRDFHFLSPAGRSNSNCDLSTGGKGGYQTARSSSDAQIPCLNKQTKMLALQQLELDSLAIDFLTDTDAQQSFISTSPQSVDSGLECLMETNSTSSTGVTGRFKRLMRTGYECDNSTDSTDSGVFSGRFKNKRSAVCTDSEDSESDADHHHNIMTSFIPTAEDDGELTPVLEASRAEEFSGQTMIMDGKKRRLLEPAMQHDQCWEDFVDVRMIDFAHTTFSGYLVDGGMGHRGPDNGYLLGLDSLVGILSELRGCCASC